MSKPVGLQMPLEPVDEGLIQPAEIELRQSRLRSGAARVPSFLGAEDTAVKPHEGTESATAFHMGLDLLLPVPQQRSRRDDQDRTTVSRGGLSHVRLEPGQKSDSLQGLAQPLFIGVEYARQACPPRAQYPVETLFLLLVNRRP